MHTHTAPPLPRAPSPFGACRACGGGCSAAAAPALQPQGPAAQAHTDMCSGKSSDLYSSHITCLCCSNYCPGRLCSRGTWGSRTGASSGSSLLDDI